MKVQNQKVLEGCAALTAIAIQERQTPWKFGGLARLAMARNLKRLSDAKDTIETTKQGLAKELGLGAAPNRTLAEEPDQEAAGKFLAEWKTLMEAESEVVLTKIKVSDLRLDENQIPLAVLNGLDWLLTEDA